MASALGRLGPRVHRGARFVGGALARADGDIACRELLLLHLLDVAVDVGDAELVEWIKQYEPDVVISGHIHQSPFVAEGSWIDRLGSTWVFNAGRQYGAPPAYIVIDTTLQEALWVSAMGAQSVRLNGPLERPIPALRALPDWFEPPPVPAF